MCLMLRLKLLSQKKLSNILYVDKYSYNLFRRITMAKLNESIIVIKVSELLKDTDEVKPIIDEALIAQLEEIIRELAGSKAIVEIERHDG